MTSKRRFEPPSWETVRTLPAFAALTTLAAITACSASRPVTAPAVVEVHPASTETDAPVTAASTTSPQPPTTTPPPAPATTGTPTTTSPAIAPTGTLARPTQDQWARVDQYLRDELLGRGDFAFGIAVSIDGDLVHEASYGDRNHPDIVPPPPETTADPSPSASGVATTTTTTTTTVPPPPMEPVKLTDRFRIASLSKIVTATVTLQLVQDGRLGLDQPVGSLLGAALGVDVAGRPAELVTVRQLLSHTSGFGTFRDTFFRRDVESCPQAAARGLARGLDYDPGTTYHYSNMNYCLLQLLIEEVTGRDYEEVVYNRLLDPLGINGMRLAGTFDPHPDEVIHPSFPGRNYMETLGGAGGWTATPAEMVRIVDALDSTKPGFHPLSDELGKLMRAPQAGTAYASAERRYGMGLIVWANKSWGHTGTIENTHSIVIHRPDGMTWSILVSGNHPEETDVLERIFQDAIDHAGIDAPAPTTTTTTTTLPPSTTAGPSSSGPGG